MTACPRRLGVCLTMALASCVCGTALQRVRAQDVAPAGDAPVPPSAAAPVEPLATAAVAPVPPPVSDSASVVQARGVVARAQALFAVGDYGAALAEFMRAHELLADDSRAAAVLNNIAVCYERMFRYDLALEYYDRYLHAPGVADDDRAEVEAVIRSLRELLGTVRVTGNVPAEIWVDDRQLGKIPADLLVPAGAHVIEARARGHESIRRELRVTARATQDQHFELAPLPTYRGLHPVYFWSGAALSMASVIVGSAFGIAALEKHADGEAMAKRGLKPDPQPTRKLALKADIAFGAALVLGVSTTLLFFLSDWKGDAAAQEKAPQSAPALTLGVGAAPGALALTLQGAVP